MTVARPRLPRSLPAMPSDDPPSLPQSLRDAAAGLGASAPRDPHGDLQDWALSVQAAFPLSGKPGVVPSTGPVGTAGRMEVLRLWDHVLNEAGRRALVTWAQGLAQDAVLRRPPDPG